VHIIEGATGGPRDVEDRPFDYAALKQAYRQAGGKGAWMGNNGYDRDLAEKRLADGDVDLVAFGKAYIANPDLVRRLKEKAPLNQPDQATFYGGGEHGYTDYPTLG
jgi:N-ethylmaleimide reductase